MLLTGLDRLPSCPRLLDLLRSHSFALLAHPASVNRSLTHISAVLAQLGLSPRMIFGPEHGYGGEAQDMIGVAHAEDPYSGAPIISLYGESFEDLVPREEHLRDVQVLLIDLADVGSRYYTFVWTALLAARKACSLGVQVIVLDRPNPIGGLAGMMEGAVQRPGYLSFVGLEPLPVRHSLTVGEIVTEMMVREGRRIGEEVEVLGCLGWDRGQLATSWDRPFVPTSPNMPTCATALVYPGGCLLEGTNLSEGRGTTTPFELFGAPFVDGRELARALADSQLPGFVARPITFRPTFHKHAGAICGGVHIHVTDSGSFRPMATYVAAIGWARQRYPEQFRFRTERYEFVEDIPAFDLLAGSGKVREAMEGGAPLRDIVAMACEVAPEHLDLHRRAVERIEAAGRD